MLTAKEWAEKTVKQFLDANGHGIIELIEATVIAAQHEARLDEREACAVIADSMCFDHSVSKQIRNKSETEPKPPRSEVSLDLYTIQYSV